MFRAKIYKRKKYALIDILKSSMEIDIFIISILAALKLYFFAVKPIGRMVCQVLSKRPLFYIAAKVSPHPDEVFAALR